MWSVVCYHILSISSNKQAQRFFNLKTSFFFQLHWILWQMYKTVDNGARSSAITISTKLEVVR
jgi:hypothetical protein